MIRFLNADNLDTANFKIQEQRQLVFVKVEEDDIFSHQPNNHNVTNSRGGESGFFLSFTHEHKVCEVAMNHFLCFFAAFSSKEHWLLSQLSSVTAYS